ncbi:hypothetical protein GJ744_008853 [Endocarpon pusillum]|uniref:Uncharacterized protein n=1 Tax=Endocarpon pusillum TaxID=364733 RepID=A0A8H7AU35_9EURO|nr:hypothetical protein GJ744_008853 [Endocarpon pusillum]
MENKKLQCQLGEAKVPLDHDHEAEERWKAELEEVKLTLQNAKSVLIAGSVLQ